MNVRLKRVKAAPKKAEAAPKDDGVFSLTHAGPPKKRDTPSEVVKGCVGRHPHEVNGAIWRVVDRVVI